MSKTLSNISTEATEETNTPGVLTPILRIQPEDGLALILQNSVQVGKERGIPFVANLEDTNGDDLPLDSDLAIGFKRPGDDDFSVVSEVRDNIEPFRQLSLTEQRDEQLVDATKIQLKQGADRLVARDVDEILILLESSAEIDYSNSRVSLNENAVREVSMDVIRGE